ncbi:TPA_asm: MarR family transcriptional regulator, partial [Listeria monocytogenes]|nr:MarR family transcriptional regulator [Listeria monocytogenes]
GPKIRVSDLGHMLRISKPSVTQMIQSLEGKGLIKRVQNPEDKRSMYVELTEVGAGVSEKMLDEFQASFEDMQEFLGEDDMKKLITLLEKLTDYLNTKSENKEA